MSSKLAQLIDQVGTTEADGIEKMSDMSLLDEMLLSSVAGGDGGGTLGSGYNGGGVKGQQPYVRYWQDL